MTAVQSTAGSARSATAVSSWKEMWCHFVSRCLGVLYLVSGDIFFILGVLYVVVSKSDYIPSNTRITKNDEKWNVKKKKEGNGICLTKVLFRRLLEDTGENYKNSRRFAGVAAEIRARHARTLVRSFTTWYKMLICNGAMYSWECCNKWIFDFNKIPGEERALSLVRWFIQIGWASKYVDCSGRTVLHPLVILTSLHGATCFNSWRSDQLIHQSPYAIALINDNTTQLNLLTFLALIRQEPNLMLWWRWCRVHVELQDS